MQAPAAISVVEGPNHVFTVVNPLYRRACRPPRRSGQDGAPALPELEGQGYFESARRCFRVRRTARGRGGCVRLDRNDDGVPEEFFVDFVYQPLKHADGHFGILVHAIDTTERVVARRRIEALATERAAILGQIADVVVTTDPDGRITFFNQAARVIYGDMRLGLPIWDDGQPFTLMSPSGEVKEVHEIPLYRALHGERVSNEEWRVRRADNSSLMVMGSAVPLAESDGRRDRCGNDRARRDAAARPAAAARARAGAAERDSDASAGGDHGDPGGGPCRRHAECRGAKGGRRRRPRWESVRAMCFPRSRRRG